MVGLFNLVRFFCFFFHVLYLERNVVTVGAWAAGHNHLSQWLTFTTCAPLLVPDCWQFPFRPGQLLLNCATHTHKHIPDRHTHMRTRTDCSWLIRIRGSHEEALGFHGTPLRIDPPLSGTSQTRYTNTPCELLPVGVHSNSGHEILDGQMARRDD